MAEDIHTRRLFPLGIEEEAAAVAVHAAVPAPLAVEGNSCTRFVCAFSKSSLGHFSACSSVRTVC